MNTSIKVQAQELLKGIQATIALKRQEIAEAEMTIEHLHKLFEPTITILPRAHARKDGLSVRNAILKVLPENDGMTVNAIVEKIIAMDLNSTVVPARMPSNVRQALFLLEKHKLVTKSDKQEGGRVAYRKVAPSVPVSSNESNEPTPAPVLEETMATKVLETVAVKHARSKDSKKKGGENDKKKGDDGGKNKKRKAA